MTGSGRSGLEGLRIGVYNRFWPTGGGGEKFAGGIAEALSSRHRVELIGHDSPDLAALAERLGLDLGAVGWRSVEPSPSAVEAASADYDVFINASYGSVLANRAPRGMYVVHFPVVGAPPPTGWRRFVLRAVGRLAKMTGTDLEPASWVGGVYAPERRGPLTHRWTDGCGELQISLTAVDRHRSGALRRFLPRRVESTSIRRKWGWWRNHFPWRVTVLVGRPGPDQPDGIEVELSLNPGPAHPDAAASTDSAAGPLPAGMATMARRTLWPGAAHAWRFWPRVPFTGVTAPVAPLLADRAGSVDDGPTRLVLRSGTHLPPGPASDQRVLGLSVLGVLVGPWYSRLLQAVHQPLSAAAAPRDFLDTYQQVVANSRFTATWVERLWGRSSEVLNPPVAGQPSGDKEPLILHVGRFFPPKAGHSKRQLELIDAFGRLVGAGKADGWALHLVGGCDDEGAAYLDQVRAAVEDLLVEVHANAPAATLRDLFARASIYWHATGLGEDPEAHPERMEHFGISTVEAMSAGAVPVAIGMAGQLEVFDDGVEGHHFASIDELVEHTAALIADPHRRQVMAAAARQRAADFDLPAFERRLFALLASAEKAVPAWNRPR